MALWDLTPRFLLGNLIHTCDLPKTKVHRVRLRIFATTTSTGRGQIIRSYTTYFTRLLTCSTDNIKFYKQEDANNCYFLNNKTTLTKFWLLEKLLLLSLGKATYIFQAFIMIRYACHALIGLLFFNNTNNHMILCIIQVLPLCEITYVRSLKPRKFFFSEPCT